MKTVFLFFFIPVLFLPCLPLFAGDGELPEKLRSVLNKLDEFEAAQIAALEAAIEKKRAEVATYLNGEMRTFARGGDVNTALTIQHTIQELEKGAPLDRIRNQFQKTFAIAGDRAQRIFKEKNFENFGQNWSGNAFYAPLAKRGVLQLNVKGAGPKYEAIGVTIPVTDFRGRPFLRIRARAEKGIVMRVDLQDGKGNGTTNWPVHESIQRSSEFRDYYFDFSRYADQKTEVDLSRIQTMVIYVNPGADAFTGAVYFDEIESSERRG